jgi:hypothetical protein
MWIGFIWLRMGSGGRSCEKGNEPLGYNQDEKFV